MSMITKLALQSIAVFAFAWMATVAAQWSSGIVGDNGSDRLAQLTQLPSGSVAFAERSKSAAGGALVSSAE